MFDVKAFLSVVGAMCVASACAVQAPTSEELAEIEDVDAASEALCSNPSGINSVMSALAVSAAKELRRWNGPVDFKFNYTSGMLELTPTGKSRCSDGYCRNTQGILDMQKTAAHNNVTFPGNIKLDVYVLRAALKKGFETQQRCNSYQSEFASDGCWYERHDLKFNHWEFGSCDTKYFFDHFKTGTQTNLDSPLQLARQLYFVGYPDNRMLNFYERDGLLSIDPTGGLNEGGTTTTGSCTAACTKFSATSLIGQCCSCNGVNKTFVRSTFNYDYYQCK